MKNYLARSAVLVVPMMLFGLPSAFALPQAPHDFEGNGISCSDCHVPYAGLADPADTEGFAAAGSTNLTLVDDTKAWDADRWVGGVVTISSGANLGQFRRITASDATSLTWERALPFALEVGDAYAIGKVTYADIETQCRSCHNPTGRASDHPTVGMHALPDGSTIGCGKCHEPHNIMPNSGEGNGLIRRDIRWPTARGEVDFPSAGENRFVDGAPGFNGICETCHTQTAAHRNDGSADVDHNVDTACGVCHSHESGFSDDSSELAEWQGSGHADAAAEAFTHWDGDGEVSASCARCHSEGGFRDYLGDDGSAVGVVDAAAPLGTTVGCSTCHADAAEVLTEVTFPSGVVVGDLGPEARCMTCHQGRSSTPQVDTLIFDAAVPDDDTVSPDISFQNVHYFAAGATVFGGIAQGGYQYAGQTYGGHVTHVEGYDSCVGCHNQHSLEVRVEECQSCHPGVANVEDLRDVRMFGTTDDFDGDGDVAEGMARELEGMSVLVYTALQQYATESLGVGIVYESSAYPYWFEDDNGNGVADPEEANFGNRYSNWTARLLRGAYNFQYYTKDPGAFAHNPKYVVQLLHDSINDLNSALVAPVPFAGARADAAAFDATGQAAGYQLSGHADRDAEAFRHWDEDGEVSTSCAKCHSNGGFLDFLGEDGSAAGTVDAPAALGSSVTCETCHNPSADALTETTFPSGDTVAGLGAEARCMQCHQGRSSTPQVDDYITAAAVPDDDTVAANLSFRNVHYMAAGATVAGTDARGGYEYAGQTYQGQLQHVPGYDDCLDCHDEHSLEVRVEECRACHPAVETAADLRNERMFGSTADYDGDGDTSEGMAHELEGLSVLAYAAIQQYATEVAGTGIAYDSHRYPYWFEADTGARFRSWTARLIRATYNYQYYQKDTGAYAHNPKYVVQLLHDTISDLNGTLAVPIAFTGDRMDAAVFDGTGAADAYRASGHGDRTAEAWIHWDEDGEVPSRCAQCHSHDGFLDYIGADGSAVGSVESAAPLGTSVTCGTCHNPTADALDSVTFPSDLVVTGLGSEARCMTCHQGRSSTIDVDAHIAGVAPADDDTVSAQLRFQNVHYFAAGATLFGGRAKGAYEYVGQVYDVNNRHVDDRDTCIGCHDQHSLAIRLDDCQNCHTDVADVEDLRDVRMFGSTGDYDGDGDVDEGLGRELEGLAAILYEAIQQYGAQVTGLPIIYNPSRYPYWFQDTNGDGIADPDETSSYAGWTARIVRATYNYQYIQKDPGAFAHNPKYVVEVMHDAIMDLNAQLAAPVVFAGARSDAGHFDGSSEAFRHWDEDEDVSASCSKCHGGATGFRAFLDTGTAVAVPQSNGMECATCHTDLIDFDTVEVTDATFPSGVTLSANDEDDNLCWTCHSGRAAKASVDASIADGRLRFLNVHYLPAASVLNGSDAHVGYEYDGRVYAGAWPHLGGNSCVNCHDPEETRHSFDVHDNAALCNNCHPGVPIDEIRGSSNADYDGDGDAAETLGAEIAGLEARLYAAMQASATANGTPMVYSAASYPYFFGDTNGNGVADPDEAVRANGFAGWTEPLMKAAFNFQLVQKEHGAWAHNFAYVGQLLFDSIEDLSGDLTGLTRP